MGPGQPVGLRRHEPTWPLFHRVERQAHLFGEMMDRVGVNPGAAAREDQGSAFAAACRRCLLCSSAEACRQWLDTGGADTPPAFCPNAAYLSRVGAGASAAMD